MTQDPTDDWSADLRLALHESAPVAMGYIPLGTAFGALVVASGLPWWVAPVTALLVYAGSLEFLLVGFLVSPPGLASVAAATLAVNFRHVFYPLSYPTGLLRKPWQRVLGAWQLTDETYALLAAGLHPTRTRQVLLLSGLNQTWWVGGALLGTLVGRLIPASFRGLDFAMTGLFAALALDFFVHTRAWRVAGYSGVAIALAMVLPGPFLGWSLGIFTLVCLGEVVIRGRGR